MDASAYYYIPAFVCWAGLGLKLPGLLHSWRDPLIRAVCWVIFLGGVGFFLAAPRTVAGLNEATGVANFSAALVYATVSAYSASCLLLIIHWRGGSDAYVRRLTRHWTVGYGVLIAVLITLFVLGDAPSERLTDFDTYYARTPWIGEMVVAYLLGHMTAAVASTVLCGRWAREVHGWLRAGLWLLVLAWLLNVSFSGLKLTAVIARWTGRDWDMLSTTLAPRLVGLAAAVAVAGFTLPLLGPWATAVWRAVTTWRRLGPLWRELGGIHPGSLLAAPIPWYASPFIHLTRREAGIEDGLRLIRPHLDDDVRSHAHTAALAAGHSADTAARIGHAAMIAAAVQACRRDGPATPAGFLEHEENSGNSGNSGNSENSGNSRDTEHANKPANAELPVTRPSLIGIAHSLRTSPIVAAARAAAAGIPAADDERTPIR
ncbi:MAB_1171c family putative transporter [Streptomyces ureilyticus]|uniref:MAB_1171c family putative transporter n=1 Tax=Streptomyces ureilyticus TaxID=1775131 RepID=UPI0019D2CE02|nr:MAB_1171c family putative transporter [Streptomyces ureilyticus]